MSMSTNLQLFFFDDGIRYPFVSKRGRTPSERLPRNLQEVRSSIAANGTNKLNQFFHKQKRVAAPQEGTSNTSPTKSTSTKKKTKLDISLVKEALGAISESGEATVPVVIKQWKKTKRVPEIEIEPETEDEDDSRFLFEEAKFNATRIILELSKYFDYIQQEPEVEPQKEASVVEVSDFLASKNSAADIVWNINTNNQNTHHKRYSPLFIADYVTEALNLNYEDLIKNATYEPRVWQTQAYKDIIGYSNSSTSVNHQDSGIFSVPPTAMSGLYVKPESPEEKKKRKMKVEKAESTQSLQTKASKDSGMTSDSDGPPIIAYRKESKAPNYNVPKPKTRLEKYFLNDKGSERRKVSEIRTSKDRKTEQFLEEVPTPPINQQLISFAISSKTSHEKGWVVQPSFLEDPENQTLIAWAHARLQQAIRQKRQEEKESDCVEKHLHCKILCYGESKKGASRQLKKSKEKKSESSLYFMITLPDGTIIVYYPSGCVAIVSSFCAGYGNYTLVYGDGNENGRLLAHFTPHGRGVCYHKNGQIAFLSINKFGLRQDESGELLKKWKWSAYNLVPPLSMQLNSNITFRCSNKSSMFLAVNMNGERTKIKLVSLEAPEDPKICAVGSLLTMEEFTSHVAIQLSKTMPKRKEEKKKKLAGQSKPTKKDGASDAMDQKMKELAISLPAEKKDIEFSSPYQLELKLLQKKFKETVANWMDHYRISTGLTSPRKLQKNFRQNGTMSAASFSSCSPSKWRAQKKKLRIPSAPTIPTYTSEISSVSESRPHSSAGDYSRRDDEERREASPLPATSKSALLISSPSKSPFKCGLLQEASKVKVQLPSEGCPIALRAELLGEGKQHCRCSKRKIPVLQDEELDEFLLELPKTQLIIISVVSTEKLECNPVDALLDTLHHESSKNRTFPCVQAQYDAYRLFKYMIPASSQHTEIPLLSRRHNVRPGMFMMYQGGRLVFANFIFDGYGNTKKNFLKQISRSRKEALQGRFLPDDFRFGTSQRDKKCDVSPRDENCDHLPFNGVLVRIVDESSGCQANFSKETFDKMEPSFHVIPPSQRNLTAASNKALLHNDKSSTALRQASVAGFTKGRKLLNSPSKS